MYIVFRKANERKVESTYKIRYGDNLYLSSKVGGKLEIIRDQYKRSHILAIINVGKSGLKLISLSSDVVLADYEGKAKTRRSIVFYVGLAEYVIELKRAWLKLSICFVSVAIILTIVLVVINMMLSIHKEVPKQTNILPDKNIDLIKPITPILTKRIESIYDSSDFYYEVLSGKQYQKNGLDALAMVPYIMGIKKMTDDSSLRNNNSECGKIDRIVQKHPDEPLDNIIEQELGYVNSLVKNSELSDCRNYQILHDKLKDLILRKLEESQLKEKYLGCVKSANLYVWILDYEWILGEDMTAKVKKRMARCKSK